MREQRQFHHPLFPIRTPLQTHAKPFLSHIHNLGGRSYAFAGLLWQNHNKLPNVHLFMSNHKHDQLRRSVEPWAADARRLSTHHTVCLHETPPPYHFLFNRECNASALSVELWAADTRSSLLDEFPLIPSAGAKHTWCTVLRPIEKMMPLDDPSEEDPSKLWNERVKPRGTHPTPLLGMHHEHARHQPSWEWSPRVCENSLARRAP